MSNTQVETIHSNADKVKVASAALLVVAGVAAYYLLAAQGGLLQWGGLAVGLGHVFLVGIRQKFDWLWARCVEGG